MLLVGRRFRQKGDDTYITRVEQCVEESLESVYNNEQGSTIRFTKHNPAHDNLRKELFAQLNGTGDASTTDEVRQCADRICRARIGPAVPSG